MSSPSTEANKSYDDWLREFQTILFRGFFCSGTAADKWREMENENIKLKQKLTEFARALKAKQ